MKGFKNNFPPLMEKKLQDELTPHDPLGNAVSYKIPIPWKQYQDRNVIDHSEAVRVIYEIDANESQKLKCFLIFQEVLKKIENMPETLRVCEAYLRSHLSAFSAVSTWQITAKQCRRHRMEDHRDRIRKLGKEIGRTIKAAKVSERELEGLAGMEIKIPEGGNTLGGPMRKFGGQ